MMLVFDKLQDTEADLQELYAMKSEQHDIYWSGYTEAPDMEKFRGWFKDQLQRTDRLVWLARDIKDPSVTVGYLYLTFEENNVAIMSNGVKAAFNGKGIGSQIINFLLNVCHTFYPEYSFEGWMAEANSASYAMLNKNNIYKTGATRQTYYASFGKEITVCNVKHFRDKQ